MRYVAAAIKNAFWKNNNRTSNNATPTFQMAQYTLKLKKQMQPPHS
jgi:hypothetical protein